jgi:hypothetical protein
MKYLKRIFICLVLLKIVMNRELVYPRFKTCDPEWGSDRLWIDYVDNRKSFTFCQDEERREEANFLNGKLMTL